MSVQAISWVLDESEAEGTDRLVLVAIANEADRYGYAFPGIDTIAEQAKCSRSSALRAIPRLEESGELLVKRPEKYGRGRHNEYVVTMGRDPFELAVAMGWAENNGPKMTPIPEDESVSSVEPISEPEKVSEKVPQKVSERSAQVTPDPKSRSCSSPKSPQSGDQTAKAKPPPRARGESPRQINARLRYHRTLDRLRDCDTCGDKGFRCTRCTALLRMAQEELADARVPRDVWDQPVGAAS